MNAIRLLCLGAGEGWHANQLQRAAMSAGCTIDFADYETLIAEVESGETTLRCQCGPIAQYAAVLTRTMPAGTLEQITFRLATLHALERQFQQGRGPALVNAPRGLEIAIDKFATLSVIANMGLPVPETIVVQSRKDAMDAFDSLGGDCVVKPIFGGEGRGVMRIRDKDLAWSAFSTLEQLGALAYIQRFVPPGGRDTRMLVIGDRIVGLRRFNENDFRTNSLRSSRCEPATLSQQQQDFAYRICRTIGLDFAAVDWIDSSDGEPKVVEVNGIPGWKLAQQVTDCDIADSIIKLLRAKASQQQPVTNTHKVRSG